MVRFVIPFVIGLVSLVAVVSLSLFSGKGLGEGLLEYPQVLFLVMFITAMFSGIGSFVLFLISPDSVKEVNNK